MQEESVRAETRVELRVLGPLEGSVGGTPISLGGPLPRAIVSRLALAGGHMVSDDALVFDIWGDEPPRTVQLTLQGYISTLRKALEPQRGTAKPTVLVRRGPGYALMLDDGAVDAQRFVAAAAQGKRALADRDYAAAVSSLDSGLALWRGPAYADCADREFAEAETRRLDELRLDAFEDRMDAAIGLGENGAAAAALDGHTREHPLRERAWELLATALYRMGRQGDAMTVLRGARAHLADELGSDPRASFVALQDAILRQDDSLDAPASSGPLPVPSRRSNLPLPITELIGRTAQLDELDAAMARHRLVTLTGPGGMGKTRTALEIARRRDDADGPWFVELAAIRDGDMLPDAIATALNITASGGRDALVAILRERRTVIDLDNCEQLLDPVAEFVTDVLASCPHISFLATSRELLSAPGEFAFDIPSLSFGDAGEAVQLFVDRAGPQLGGWTPDADERELLAQLCAELDGMPLAIELAAAQCRTLSVRQLVDNIDDRFSVLRGGPRTNRRHSTMLAAVDWSYESLGESEKTLFQDLAIFDGGFDLDGAVTVTGRPSLLVDLGTLIDKSLVKPLGGDPRRYRMLETLRSYGSMKRTPERGVVLRDRHTAWIVDTAEAAYFGLRGPNCPAWMDRLDAEMPNIRAALEHSDLASVTYLRIVGSLYWYWYRRGHVAEGLRHLEPAMKAKDVPIGVAVRAVAGLTITRYLAGDIAGLLESFGRLAELEPDTAADPVARSDALVSLAFFEAGAGLVDQARLHADEALALGEVIAAPYTRAEALMSSGTAALRSGDLDLAERLLAEAAAVSVDCGYQWCEGSSLWIHAKVDIARQRWGGPAETKLARMIDACDQVSDTSSWMVGLVTLAYVLFRRDELHDAARLMGVVDRYSELIGYIPAKMDPIDIGRYEQELRDAISVPSYASATAEGRALGRSEVRTLVLASVPS